MEKTWNQVWRQDMIELALIVTVDRYFVDK